MRQIRIAKFEVVESTTHVGLPSLRPANVRVALLEAGFIKPGEKVVVVAETDFEQMEKFTTSQRTLHPKCVISGTGADFRCKRCQQADAALNLTL